VIASREEIRKRINAERVERENEKMRTA